jgi:hypothetical protein
MPFGSRVCKNLNQWFHVQNEYPETDCFIVTDSPDIIMYLYTVFILNKRKENSSVVMGLFFIRMRYQPGLPMPEPPGGCGLEGSREPSHHFGLKKRTEPMAPLLVAVSSAMPYIFP